MGFSSAAVQKETNTKSNAQMTTLKGNCKKNTYLTSLVFTLSELRTAGTLYVQLLVSSLHEPAVPILECESSLGLQRTSTIFSLFRVSETFTVVFSFSTPSRTSTFPFQKFTTSTHLLRKDLRRVKYPASPISLT